MSLTTSNMNNVTIRKQAKRIFKKSSPNGKIVMYLSKRDFVDYIDHVDPIDGVVLIDRDYVEDKKVFVNLDISFRCGNENLVAFRKHLHSTLQQIFPALLKNRRKPTALQDQLMKKLGPNAYPFHFNLPPRCPASVTLQPTPSDTGKPCGIDYELTAFINESQDDKEHKRNSVKLFIRKITYAVSKKCDQPFVEVSQEFMKCPYKLHLEASLDKELYHHGENIAVSIHIVNRSNRTVTKIKISVRQFADICLFSPAQYKCIVTEIESEDGYSISPGYSMSKVFTLAPLSASMKDKKGVALDGPLDHKDTNLAPSTLALDRSQGDNFGIIVRYKVKVKLCLGPQDGDLVAELPFTLVHPKPKQEIPQFVRLSKNGDVQNQDSGDGVGLKDFAQPKSKRDDKGAGEKIQSGTDYNSVTSTSISNHRN